MRVFVNGEAREVPLGTTVADLVSGVGKRLGAVAVEVNLEVVPRADQERRVLKEGDTVEVVHFVGGG